MKHRWMADDTRESLAPAFSAEVLSALTYSLVIISGSVLLFWPRDPLYTYVGTNRGPLLFFQTFSVMLLILSYINLRCGRGEMIKTDFTYGFEKKDHTPEKERHFLRYGLFLFAWQTLFTLFPFLPVLTLTATVSGIPGPGLTQALSVLYATVFLCRLFGFFTYLLWGRASVAGYLLIRGFAVFYLLATAGLTPSVNPLRMIYQLNITGLRMAAYLFYLSAALCAVLMLTVLNTLLIDRHIKAETRA